MKTECKLRLAYKRILLLLKIILKSQKKKNIDMKSANNFNS